MRKHLTSHKQPVPTCTFEVLAMAANLKICLFKGFSSHSLCDAKSKYRTVNLHHVGKLEMINIEGLPWWPSGRVFALHVGDRDSIPGRDRPKSFKEAITAPLPSARQQV